ncbi:MAG: phytanoyl-CoA dioxygenase family protein, partial [Proteobacteria bacterium]|nr:phytanoyl-CoA dioxygenase family protein [Pseudomonadota bacterium]
MPQLARFDARTTDPQEVGRAIDVHGYAIVENMMTPDQLAALRAELEPHFATQKTGETAFLGARTKRFNNLFMRAPTTRQMVLHPVLLGAADHILLPHCARYQVTYTGVMHLMPGEKAQALHRDGFFYPFRNPGPVLQQGSLWAVTEFTADNGATRIVPGSHLWEEERAPRANEIFAAEMPAGSA